MLCNHQPLSAFLRFHAAKRARRIHKTDYRPPKLFSLSQRAHRFAVALGVRHAEVAAHALFERMTLLLPDYRDGPALKPRNRCNNGFVVTETAVALDFKDAAEQLFNIISCLRPVFLTGA